MKNRLKIGEKRIFTHKVQEEDIATFASGTVHNVCSTFTMAKYIEWTSRLFIIDIKNEDEEGIGTMIKINHLSPAFINQELLFEATVKSINQHELICEVIVSFNGRRIAKAETGQKLLKTDKINEIFSILSDPKI